MSPHPLDGVAPDALAKEVLGRLPRRSVVGEALSDRVGARGWAPPRFASGRKLYARVGLPDPWDPGAAAVGTGLGDVAMPQPRQPAPHLSPPASSAKAAPTRPPGFPNLPSAPTRREPAEGGKPAPRIGDVRKADPNEGRPKEPTRPAPAAVRSAPPSGTFGPGAPKHAVVKLPMRPGVVAPGEAEPGFPGVIPSRLPASASPPRTPAPPAPTRPGESTPVRSSGGMISARTHAAPSPPSSAAVSLPIPPEPAPAVAPAEPPPPPKPPAPVNRKPPGPSGGLDDLFGMGGGGDNTRIRMPKPEPEGEAPRPRRPTVTSPEELARLGLDRRPPPPKPPDVKPSGPAPSAKPDPVEDSDE